MSKIFSKEEARILAEKELVKNKNPSSEFVIILGDYEEEWEDFYFF